MVAHYCCVMSSILTGCHMALCQTSLSFVTDDVNSNNYVSNLSCDISDCAGSFQNIGDWVAHPINQWVRPTFY